MRRRGWRASRTEIVWTVSRPSLPNGVGVSDAAGRCVGVLVALVCAVHLGVLSSAMLRAGREADCYHESSGQGMGHGCCAGVERLSQGGTLVRRLAVGCATSERSLEDPCPRFLRWGPPCVAVQAHEVHACAALIPRALFSSRRLRGGAGRVQAPVEWSQGRAQCIPATRPMRQPQEPQRPPLCHVRDHSPQAHTLLSRAHNGGLTTAAALVHAPRADNAAPLLAAALAGRPAALASGPAERSLSSSKGGQRGGERALALRHCCLARLSLEREGAPTLLH